MGNIKKTVPSIKELEKVQKIEKILREAEGAEIKVKDAKGEELTLVYDPYQVDVEHAEMALGCGEVIERFNAIETMTIDNATMSDFKIAIRKAVSFLLCRRTEKGLEKPSLSDSEAYFEMMGSLPMAEVPKLRLIAADFFTCTGMSQVASLIQSGRKKDALTKILEVAMTRGAFAQ